MDNKGLIIPPGYDLETSFYHFSLALAIKMYVHNRTSVPAKEYNYAYPRFTRASDTKFEEFFKEEDKVRLAR